MDVRCVRLQPRKRVLKALCDIEAGRWSIRNKFTPPPTKQTLII